MMVSIEMRTETHTPQNCDSEFANREIIAREPATMPHASTGRPVTLRCATRVLLAPPDGYETRADDGYDTGNDKSGDIAYECVKCGLVFRTSQSVIAHHIAHINVPNTRYPLHTLQTLIRLMRYAIRHNIDNAAMRVAHHLNVIDAKTLTGIPWNAAQVQALYDRWKSTIRVRVTKNTQLIDLDASITPDSPTHGRSDIVESDDHSANIIMTNETISRLLNNASSNGGYTYTPSLTVAMAHDVVRTFKDMTRVISVLATQLNDITPTIERINDAVSAAAQPDPTIVDKAQRWDEMRQLFDK